MFVDGLISSAGRNNYFVERMLAQIMTLERKMAANTTPALRVELGNVHNLQLSEISPFSRLSEKLGRPLKVAILSDFVRIPYANGAAFQTRFLYQELRQCGHEVTVIGPHDPDARADELAPGTISIPSLPLKTYPGVHLPMPLASWVYDLDEWDFDICFAQTTSLLMEFGVWLRKMKKIPLLCVNTTHLEAAYEVLLPEKLASYPLVHAAVRVLQRPLAWIFASMYNNSDGLIVLSEGLRDFWRGRGVTAPIFVIPRAVQPQIFDRAIGADPYAKFMGELGDKALPGRGQRLLCAGRHTREKSQDRVIRIFAEHVLPQAPDATLTMIGVGPDTEYYKRVALESGVADRVFFPGEVPFTTMPDFYAYADVFVHGSLSETYGNVMGEALWCGTPTVAFADGMGVSSQIRNGVNGILVEPGSSTSGEEKSAGDRAFGEAVVKLLSDARERGRIGKMASKVARGRAMPELVLAKIADAFERAHERATSSTEQPVSEQGLLRRWATTARHFGMWTLVLGGIYAMGYMRPAKREKALMPAQPQIAC